MIRNAAIAAAILLAGVARADDRASAERYFRAGAKAYAAQSFAAAAADFDEAYKALPLPEIAFSAAQAYRRQYRVDPKPEYVKRAVELYRIYLQQVKTGGRVGDAADSLGELERELDKLKSSGVVAGAATAVEHTRLGASITVADQSGGETTAMREVGDATGELAKGLAVTLDGKPLTPFALVDVEPREHVLAVTADGYLPVEKKAMAVAGQSQLIEIELRPQPAKLVVATEADAKISIDGRAVATAPAGVVELAAGMHLLAIAHRGREPFARELVVTRGQALTVDAPLAATARRRAVPWVLGGAGVLAAGAITTSIFALSHDGKASKLRTAIAGGDRPPSDGDQYDQEVASRDHFVTATWILGGAAVAAGATAAWLYFFDQPTTSEGLHVAPTASPTSVGLALGGSF